MNTTNTCTVCGKNLSLDNFAIRGNKTKLHRICLKCRKNINKLYYSTDRAEYCKEYYKANKERIAQYQKEYQVKNLACRKKYEKEYREKNKERRKIYQKEYYEKNKK
jgi:hypothetical protein